ncbi:terminase large subunit domain-containing protein [Zavarzinia compransoris]|uniref:Terminase large subunit gp17-like C-terminal domain-containing protein n=1 Tax=Zavarzinia compransoris TaxID=1264899 RepID=A0A317EDS7_9PROT|nr:terminase family protein [Zavarzinia compransoris]PWR23365.1 hypothetical protein DKG75_02005 [Zavarzinia compransoris]TDP46061.1 phage FluMu gp28-like protein [Zavarzinia compransoris]
MIMAPSRELAAGLGDEPLLLSYQQGLLSTTALNGVTICEKSRRVGFTWAIAADAVLMAASAKGAGGMDVFYLAYEKEMTREFIDTCAQWAKLFDRAASAVEEFLFDGDGDKDVMAFRIRFASGYEIIALSSNPRGLRGRQGYVIIDEAAFHDSLDEVMKAALALRMWGGKILVISTHNGVDNPYNRLVEEARTGRKPYALVRVTLDDALRAGLYRRICLTQGRAWSQAAEDEWRAGLIAEYGEAADEELFCIPSQSAGCWIDPVLISAATHPDAGRPDLYQGGRTFIGNDIARRHDGWVADAIEMVGDVMWQREEVILLNQPFAVHDETLDDLVRRYRPLRVAMDQTGMGEKPVEDAKARYGQHRVEGVLMSGDRPMSVALAARRAFEERLVRLGDDPDLRAQIRMIKRQVGATGAPRLITGRDAKSHADRAWALFLAIAAASDGGAPIEFRGTGVRRHFNRVSRFAGPPRDGFWRR